MPLIVLYNSYRATIGTNSVLIGYSLQELFNKWRSNLDKPEKSYFIRQLSGFSGVIFGFEQWMKGKLESIFSGACTEIIVYPSLTAHLTDQYSGAIIVTDN